MADRKTMAMRLFGHPLRWWIRNAGSEAGVWSATIVMSDPFLKDSAKMPFTTRDHPIPALSANGADHAFAIRIRLRRPHRRGGAFRPARGPVGWIRRCRALPEAFRGQRHKRLARLGQNAPEGCTGRMDERDDPGPGPRRRGSQILNYRSSCLGGGTAPRAARVAECGGTASVSPSQAPCR